MNTPPENLAEAFPIHLRPDLMAMLQVADLHSTISPAGSFTVTVENEPITIPHRVYYDSSALDLAPTLSTVQGHLLAAVFTRHHDGHVRERALRHIIGVAQAWIAPFVVQLIGEYVIEILDLIESMRSRFDAQVFSAFLRANPAFHTATKQRVVSYWNCYYRHEHWDKNSYVGFKLLQWLESLVSADSKSSGPAGAA